MSEKLFEPLIKKTTLKDKPVEIKDTMNFDRRTKKEKKKDAAIKREEPKINHRKITMKTQKMSLDVLLKLEIIDPFLRSAEHIEHDGKLSINEKIDILIDSYIGAKLSSRQVEGFKAIYGNYVGE